MSEYYYNYQLWILLKLKLNYSSLKTMPNLIHCVTYSLRMYHCPPPGKGVGKSHAYGLIQCSFKAASAAVGISVRGIDIIKRLFVDNTRNDYYSEPNMAKTAVHKDGVPFVFSVDNVAFVVTDDGPEDPDLFAGKAYCATTLSGVTGVFSKRACSLLLSAADITFMEGDSLQRKRSCSLLQDAVDLAKQCLECTLPPVLLHRTPYVLLAKGSNVLDVKLECGTERGSTLNINLTCITMRHTLPLHWPTRLKSLIVALTNQLRDGGSHPSSSPKVGEKREGCFISCPKSLLCLTLLLYRNSYYSHRIIRRMQPLYLSPFIMALWIMWVTE